MHGNTFPYFMYNWIKIFIKQISLFHVFNYLLSVYLGKFTANIMVAVEHVDTSTVERPIKLWSLS
jgi:hypothetical protein